MPLNFAIVKIIITVTYVYAFRICLTLIASFSLSKYPIAINNCNTKIQPGK